MKKTILITVAFMLALPFQAFATENLFYYFENVYGFSDFKKNYKEIDILAPQVYEVDYDLTVSTPNKNQKKILTEAKKRNTKVMPLLVNNDFSKVLMSDILINPSAQDKIIDFLIKEAKSKKYIGWQYDFENINHLDRDLFTAFVAKTYTKFKAEDLQFAVAVSVRNRPYNKEDKVQDWSSAFDYKKLALNSDFLTLMTYDDPNSFGPVASLPYVNAVLDYILTEVSPDKLSLGIPAYCWQWQNGSRTNSTTYNLTTKAYKKADKKTRENSFFDFLGTEYFKFERDGIVNQIWCDSDESFEIKEALIKQKGMRGFSMWALGQEDPSIWRSLKYSK